MKWVVAFLVGLGVGAYSAFMAMCFWNWFATPAFHLPPLSFLETLGLVWLVQVLRSSVSEGTDPQLRAICTLLDSVVPEDKREAHAAALRDIEQGAWFEAASGALGQLAANTAMLGLGFGLHLIT